MSFSSEIAQPNPNLALILGHVERTGVLAHFFTEEYLDDSKHYQPVGIGSKLTRPRDSASGGPKLSITDLLTLLHEHLDVMEVEPFIAHLESLGVLVGGRTLGDSPIAGASAQGRVPSTSRLLDQQTHVTVNSSMGTRSSGSAFGGRA